MITIYRTVDGKEFTNKAEAEQHEYELESTKILMFGEDGKQIDSTNYAIVVYLENDLSCERFLKMCEEQADNLTAGIKQRGLYIWDYYAESFTLIDKDSYEALRGCLNYLEENEQ